MTYSLRIVRLFILLNVKGEMKMSEKLTGYPSIDKPWLKYYSDEAINAPLPECTIYDYLYENNKDCSDDIAINYYGRKITFGELFENIDCTAKGFAALGVKPGDIVTVALPSVPEALYAVYALNKLGAVANMIHPLAGKQEILHYLNEVESNVAVLFDGTYEIMGSSIGETRVKHAVVVSAADSLPFGVKLLYGLKHKSAKLPPKSTFLTWKHFLNGGVGTALPIVKKNPDEMAIISHTGGTTGEPKGVMCSDKNVNSLIYQLVCNFEYSRQGVCLAILPPFINYSLIDSMLTMLFIGFEVVLIPKYIPEKLPVYIKKYRPYVINSIPAYWEVLLKIPNVKSFDMSCLKYMYYGGESMNTETETAISDLLQSCGARGQLCKGLGSTEMMAAATQTYEECNTNGSAGVPLVWVNCKIVDPGTTDELSYGQEGEICFSGPTLMLGYYNKKDQTDEVVKVHSDGQRWFHTGDIGYIDKSGLVFVTGRIKRIFMTKGSDGVITKIFPDRIEKVLMQHPAISLCCTIGIKDDSRIQYSKAFVCLNDGISCSDDLTDEILSFCKDKLPGYMIPAEIEYCPNLPRTSRGKIDYRALERKAEEASGH